MGNSVSVKAPQKVAYQQYHACEQCKSNGQKGWAMSLNSDAKDSKKCSSGTKSFVCSQPGPAMCENANPSQALGKMYFTQGDTVSQQVTAAPVSVTCEYDMGKLVPKAYTDTSDENVAHWLHVFNSKDSPQGNDAAVDKVLGHWCTQDISQDCKDGTSSCKRYRSLAPSAVQYCGPWAKGKSGFSLWMEENDTFVFIGVAILVILFVIIGSLIVFNQDKKQGREEAPQTKSPSVPVEVPEIPEIVAE